MVFEPALSDVSLIEETVKSVGYCSIRDDLVILESRIKYRGSFLTYA